MKKWQIKKKKQSDNTTALTQNRKGRSLSRACCCLLFGHGV